MIALLALRDRLELCFGLNNPALKNILWLRSDPGGGYYPISGIQVCAAPKGVVFEPFWSENDIDFKHFWSEIGYGYRGNVHESL